MLRIARGFTLTELLSVVAIIAVLALVVLPAYNNHSIRAANRACLTEVSAYIIVAKAAMHDGVALPATNATRCTAINTTAVGTLGTPGTITAAARTPGDATISCSMATNGTCVPTSPSGN